MSEQFNQEVDRVLKNARGGPQMVGFVVRSGQGNEVSKVVDLKTAREVKKAMSANAAGHYSIYGAYADGSRRIVGSTGEVAWHVTPRGAVRNDYLPERNGRGRTIHAFAGKRDPRYRVATAIHSIEDDIRPGNFSAHDVETLPPELWSMARESIDAAVNREDLTPLAALYDELQDRLSYHPTGEHILGVLKHYLNYGGVEF